MPSELDRIVQKTLRKNSHDRHQQMRELLAELRAVSQGGRNARKPGAAAAAVLALIVGGLVSASYTESPPSIPPRDESAARQLYVKGRFFWNKRTIAGVESSIKYFEEALKIDPTHAPAYAGLADSYFALTGNPAAPGPPRDYLPRARRAALEAIRLDPANVEARVTMAAIRHMADWDWAGAEREFKAALALDPRYPSAHHRYGVFLAFMRRFDEAIASLKRAEQLDPVSLAIATDLGMTYNFARQPDRAIVQLRKALEIDPTFGRARFNLGEAYEQKGLVEEAAALFDQSPQTSHVYPARIFINRFHTLAGRPPETRQILEELLTRQTHEYVPALFVAELHAMLGEDREAFRWLDKAYDEGGFCVLRLFVDPRWERYRIYSDPRFSRLLRRVGLPPQTQKLRAPL